MTEAIVDTNVAVIANGQNGAVVQSCFDACVRFIAHARTSRVILVDEGDEVRKEYAQAIADRRPYQLGAHFLFHILYHQYDLTKVRRVKLDKDASGAFVDFPSAAALAAFDRSDRKFAALAKKTGVKVTNAADSDWCHHLAALHAHGIMTEHLCGADPTKWFDP